MATQPRIVDFLLDQFGDAGGVTAKKMFGEYGLFLEGRMFAMICDDRLFFKPTPAGRALFTEIEEAAPYPGAKPCLVVPEEAWDDREWLAELARTTAMALPMPRNKPAKKKA
jgi:TfoX/Sxy family transcriptional regulator of competence genes